MYGMSASLVLAKAPRYRFWNCFTIGPANSSAPSNDFFGDFFQVTYSWAATAAFASLRVTGAGSGAVCRIGPTMSS
jgi:hypothetical protein